jgi:hypothetical protein
VISDLHDALDHNLAGTEPGCDFPKNLGDLRLRLDVGHEE